MMGPPTAGYSGTPLWKKLGLKAQVPATVIHPPADYNSWLTGAAVPEWGPLRPGVGFIHIFTPLRAEFEDVCRQSLALMARDGMIWVSWPKKASRLPCDYTEDTIREVCLPLGLVDVKVCAVSEVWSGLKLMIRKADR